MLKIPLHATVLLVALMIGGALSFGEEGTFYNCSSDGKFSYFSNPEDGSCRKEETYQKKPKSVVKPKSTRPPLLQETKPTPPPISSSGSNQFKTISPDQQSQLDDKRVKVLVYELQQEQNIKNYLHEKIKTLPSDAEEKRGYYQEQIRIHNQNITAITQELDRLGIYANHTGN